MAVLDDEIIMKRIKKRELVKILVDKGFTQERHFTKILSTKIKNKKLNVAGAADKNESNSSSEEDVPENDSSFVPLKEYNYLIQMPMISMTYEKVKKLQAQVEDKKEEIRVLKAKSP